MNYNLIHGILFQLIFINPIIATSNKYLDNANYVLGTDFYDLLTESESAPTSTDIANKAVVNGPLQDDYQEDYEADNDSDNDYDDSFQAPAFNINNTIYQPATYTEDTLSVTSNLTTNTSGTCIAGGVDCVQNKGAGKTVGKVFLGIGEFICGFFMVCSILDTVANVGLEIGEALTSKNKQVEQAIKEATKYVSIRS